MKSKKDQRRYYTFLNNVSVSDNLKKRSLRGGLWTMSGGMISFIIRFVSTIILARILIPEYFGLIGMVTALTAIAENFKDLGLSLATVQKKEITHEQVSNLFWINLIIGVLIMLIICSFSKLIAWFYDDNRLILIALAISSSFFFGGMTVQHSAILRRKMQYAKITSLNIGSDLISSIIAIWLAIKGYEYWALVWREILRSILIAVGSWLICPWIPGFPMRNAGIGKMVRFGRDITGFNLVEFSSRNLDQILLGKFSGPYLLGIYRQAYQLVFLPIMQLFSPVQYVAESTLSVLQNDPSRYRQYYKKIVTALTFFLMPLMVFIFLYSDHIILLLFGEKWIKSAQIIRILAIAGFIRPATSSTGFVMITCGKTKRFFFIGVASSTLQILAFIIGIHWDAVGIAFAHVARAYLFFLPLIYFSFRDTPISVKVFLASIIPSIISSISMGVILYYYTVLINFQNSFNAICGSIPIAIVIYFTIWIMIPEGMARLKELYSDFLFTFKKTESERTIIVS